MIIKNGKTISSIYKGSQVINKIYKGTLVVYEAFKKLIASGVPPLTLTKCKGVDLVDYKLYGNSVQDGTPTPDTPIEVESVGDKTKNLVDIPTITESVGNGTVIKCNLTKPFVVSCQEYPKSIVNSSGVETSIWRLQFSYLDGTKANVWDAHLKNPNLVHNLKLNASEENPVKSITYRGTYIKEGQYSDIQIEYGEEITDFEPYGYKIPVKARGINLIDEKTMKTGYIGATGGIITGHAQGEKISDYIEIDNTKTYSVKQYTDYSTPYIMTALYDKDKNFISGTRKTANKTFLLINNIDSNAKYIKISARALEYDNNFIQFAEGNYTTDTMPNYELYQEPVTTNIYLKEPLRKIRDYADYIDFENKKVVRNVIIEKLDSSKNWAMYADIQTDVLGFYYYNKNILRDGYCNILSKAQNDIGYGAKLQVNYEACTLSNFYVKIALFKNRGISDVTTLKTYLDSINAYVCVPFSTSIEETIELSNIPTIKGTTILSVDTNIQPSNMEVVYKGK